VAAPPGTVICERVRLINPAANRFPGYPSRQIDNNIVATTNPVTATCSRNDDDDDNDGSDSRLT
jgi:hypothetical protein